MSDKRDQARSRWMQIFENLYPKYESLFRYGTELVVADAETLKTYGEDGKEYTLQIAPWEDGEEQESKLESDSSPTCSKTETVDTVLISRQAVFCILENKMIDRPLASDRWVIRDIGKAIESLHPVEPQPVCEDAISRQAAIEVIKQYDFNFPQYMERFATELRDAMKEDLLDDIQSLPPVEPERPRGEWIKVPNRETVYACDQCGCEPYYFGDINTIKFCPNCGSRMCREDGEA